VADDSGLPSGLTADVKALIEMMARGGIDDLTLEAASVKLRLRVGRPAVVGVGAGGATHVVPAAVAAAEPSGVLVNAPMIGTYYRGPKPGDPFFVEVGDAIEVGQTIGIIEAMKIMNEIASESAGVVAEIIAVNGQPVEFGQPLLRLDPPADD